MIDKVAHRAGCEIHYYSSKPTLLPTLLSAQYSMWKVVTGWNLEDHRFPMAKLILIFSNVLPFMLYLALIAILVHRFSQTIFTACVVILVAGLGTFLSTFAISLNNHLPAAIAVSAVIFCGIQVKDRQVRGLGWYVVAGLASAFAVSNELPALSFFCLAALAFLVMCPRLFLLGFLPQQAWLQAPILVQLASPRKLEASVRSPTRRRSSDNSSWTTSLMPSVCLTRFARNS